MRKLFITSAMPGIQLVLNMSQPSLLMVKVGTDSEGKQQHYNCEHTTTDPELL